MEIERRRNLTDLEREEENLKLGTDATEKQEGVAYNFMQKYYKKGGYAPAGVDTSQEIFQRDYNMPTGLDKFDKTVLRKVQQKRGNDFGRKGASKYTHLTDQDTTNFDPRHRVPDHLSNRLKN